MAVAQLLEKRGLGIEPDVRFGGGVPTPTSSVVVFRRGEEPVSAPGPRYGTALAIINLGTLVAAADGTVTEPERAALRDLAFSGLDLSTDERIRLDAHAALVLTKPPTAAALRRRLSVLPDEHRADVGRLLTTIAAADGRVTPDEVRTLEKLFRELGLDPNDVYSTLHATVVAGEPDELTSVRLPGATPAGRAIPAQPERTATLTLDPARLARTRAESAAVAAELAEIFAEEPEPVPAPPPVAAQATAAELDAAHTTLLRQLVEKDTVTRGEFDDLAVALALLPGGALEVLNEAALDATDELLIEGEDPLEINHDIAKDILQ